MIKLDAVLRTAFLLHQPCPVDPRAPGQPTDDGPQTYIGGIGGCFLEVAQKQLHENQFFNC
jgi:hypothetical protein